MVITGTTSVAAGATSANLLTGDINEFLGRNSAISLYACAAAAAVNATLIIGADVAIDDQEVSDANRWPIVPDDIVDSAGGFAGDRLTLRYRNTTAGALVVQWRLVINAVQ